MATLLDKTASYHIFILRFNVKGMRKMNREQLNQIIQEEELRLVVRDALNENVVQAGKKVLVDTGIQVLTNMMQSQEGRNQLASILTALPDFFKKTVCRIDPSEVGPESNIGALSKACGLVASVAGAPLYGAAKLLPLLSDDEAAVVVDAAKKIPGSKSASDSAKPVGAQSGPSDNVDLTAESDEDEGPDEVSRPLPVYEQIDAEILSVYEDEDEDETVDDEEKLEEVKALIARNEARNERFRKLAGF